MISPLKDARVWLQYSENDLRYFYRQGRIEDRTMAALELAKPRPGRPTLLFFLYGIDRAGKAHETGTCSPDFPND